ncbi:NfeD family protein [Clostridium sp. JN-9]|uniref:NfeD family protein n=1 Tax=Clostridium sp. JN-9 TaxID=2507159 RepID=UPI000FFE0996|nr:NfeD family protein [Clostridium sp. JN-9]QAT41126.1 NfeD family protein [Clostridium sp. JN-9]
MNNSLILWIIIGAVALVADLITSVFLFVWFTIGSIAAIIAMSLGYSTTVQVITFVSVSAVFMAVGYPLIKETIKKTVKKTPTMEQSYIGRKVTVDEEVMEKAIIKINGIYWTVKNIGEPVKKGDSVEICDIEGNKLLIKKIK